MTAAALDYACSFLRWLLDRDGGERRPLRGRHVSCVRGEIEEAINCIRRAQSALRNEEAKVRGAEG